ncbi:MAG UNVERIFIED_CONTAM: hypothetical protein LVR18_41045 [Planctomycetaceae bacterium]
MSPRFRLDSAMIARFVFLLLSAPLAVVATSVIADDQHLLHSFSRQQLSDVYYSEGISVGDLNNDSHKDVVYGPHWYAGPDFTKKQELYPAVPQPRERYADNFFNWVHDFDGDGWRDVLVVGFPGRRHSSTKIRVARISRGFGKSIRSRIQSATKRRSLWMSRATANLNCSAPARGTMASTRPILKNRSQHGRSPRFPKRWRRHPSDTGSEPAM